MKILSIETSCDETAVSILDCSGDLNSPHFEVLGNMVASQADMHAQYGGVFPAMAKREHAKNIWPVCKKVLKEAELFRTQKSIALSEEKELILKEILEREENLYQIFLNEISTLEKPDIDYIGVTTGPGLEPALWVGISFAKALGVLWDVPVIPINHMEGHILSFFGSKIKVIKNEELGIKNEKIQNENSKTESKQLKANSSISFPAMSLLISGGHTELVLIKSWGQYQKIGQTLDDAIGEAFDKTARVLGLKYPGGPQISLLAETARSQNLVSIITPLPRPMLHSPNYDFSFSGIKTAVLYKVKEIGKNLTDDLKKEIARDFEESVTEVLLKKTLRAMDEYGCDTLIIGGGVSANIYIRKSFEEAVSNRGGNVLFPDKELSTDNSEMIAIATYFNILNQKEIRHLKADGNWSL